MTLPPEIPRAWIGVIIDEVFYGAIEDSTVIEEIYRVIARKEREQARAEHDFSHIIEQIRAASQRRLEARAEEFVNAAEVFQAELSSSLDITNSYAALDKAARILLETQQESDDA